jgi:very-short-patch-repair endonuclease
MRRDSAYVENLFWQEIRDRKLGGFKFRRQVPVGPYYADYLCAPKKVIVELDGGVHKLKLERDKARDAALRESGYRVARFSNQEVLADLPGVLAKLLHVLQATPSPFVPLPRWGRGKS